MSEQATINEELGRLALRAVRAAVEKWHSEKAQNSETLAQAWQRIYAEPMPAEPEFSFRFDAATVKIYSRTRIVLEARDGSIILLQVKSSGVATTPLERGVCAAKKFFEDLLVEIHDGE